MNSLDCQWTFCKLSILPSFWQIVHLPRVLLSSDCLLVLEMKLKKWALKNIMSSIFCLEQCLPDFYSLLCSWNPSVKIPREDNILSNHTKLLHWTTLDTKQQDPYPHGYAWNPWVILERWKVERVKSLPRGGRPCT